jgi:hypothetical protein
MMDLFRLELDNYFANPALSTFIKLNANARQGAKSFVLDL